MSLIRLAIQRVNYLIHDERAFTLSKIMDIVIAVIFVAVLLPLGFAEWTKSEASINPNGSLYTIWHIAPVLITLGVIVGLVYMALGSKEV